MSSKIASVAECDAFLAAHPEVKFVQIFFTNQSGVPRGKNLLRHDIKPTSQASGVAAKAAPRLPMNRVSPLSVAN